MILLLKRRIFTANTTIGTLSIEGQRICDTLEDADRKLEEGGKKIYGRTAIPRGKYEVKITWSNRFKKYMMEVLEVGQYQGVRLHAGNSHADTDGCPLLGEATDEYTLINSRVMTNRVYDMVEKALKTEKVWLEVI